MPCLEKPLNFFGKHGEGFDVFGLGEHIERGYAFDFIYSVFAAHFKERAVYVFKRARQKSEVPRER